MNKLSFFIPYVSFNGCFTTIIDLFYNYNRNKELIVYNSNAITSLYTIMNIRFNKKICNDIIKSLTLNFPNRIERCCSTFSLIDYIITNNITISGDTIYLIDSGEVFNFYIHNKNDIINYCITHNMKYKKIYILLSENNLKYINSINNVEIISYKHNLSRYRLDNTKVYNNNKIIDSETYGKIKNHNKNIHSYSGYKYNRWYKYTDKIYYENIGKLLFEFIYYNKKSIYSNKNKCIDDGLTYMFNRFGLSDNKDFALSDILSKYDVEQELLDKEFIIF